MDLEDLFFLVVFEFLPVFVPVSVASPSVVSVPVSATAVLRFAVLKFVVSESLESLVAVALLPEAVSVAEESALRITSG